MEGGRERARAREREREQRHCVHSWIHSCGGGGGDTTLIMSLLFCAEKVLVALSFSFRVFAHIAPPLSDSSGDQRTACAHDAHGR